MSFLLKNGGVNSFRNILKYSRIVYQSVIRQESGPGNQVSKTAQPTATTSGRSATDELRMSGRAHKVDNLEKRFLVWSGKYKSIDEVPATVSQETMEKSRNKARIKIANYMMLATVIACIGMVISGKQAAKRGESVQKANMEWHRQVKEDAEKNALDAQAVTK